MSGSSLPPSGDAGMSRLLFSAARARNFPCRCRKRLRYLATILGDGGEWGVFGRVRHHASAQRFLFAHLAAMALSLPASFTLWADEEAPKAQELAKATDRAIEKLTWLGGCGRARRLDQRSARSAARASAPRPCEPGLLAVYFAALRLIVETLARAKSAPPPPGRVSHSPTASAFAYPMLTQDSLLSAVWAA